MSPELLQQKEIITKAYEAITALSVVEKFRMTDEVIKDRMINEYIAEYNSTINQLVKIVNQ